ncbi:MAG TPA: hypothetical protein VNI02_07160, partial [Blastocatellia bacterium]|nr:hypothetical protein [Blastocatellia bacterium]
MIERRKELYRSIESVVGDEHVTIDSTSWADTFGPVLLVRPGSAEEVARCLRVCAEFNAAVI